MRNIFSNQRETPRRPKTPGFLRAAGSLARGGIKNVEHILAIALTGHGGSLAYLNRSGLVRCSILDRWVGAKNTLMFAAAEERAIRNDETIIDRKIRETLTHAFGRFPNTRIFEATFPPWLNWLLHGLGVGPDDIDLVVTSESYFATCSARLGPVLSTWLPSASHFAGLEHHDVHQRQAFWQSGLKEAAILTLDTCGESLSRLGGHRISGTMASMNLSGQVRVFRELLFPESSPGLIYAAVNHHIGFLQGEEGKTMGLAPFGEPTLFRELRPYLKLRDDGGFEFLNRSELESMLSRYIPPRQATTNNSPILPKHRDVAYAGQALVEDILVNACRGALKLTGLKDLAYAGGLALNSVANAKARRASSARNFYIAPNPGDTGHALGCALFGAYELAGWEPPERELPEYLGPSYSPQEIESAAHASKSYISQPKCPEEIIARCIANAHIVARFAGCAEFGPRALGNRSLLCDPRRADMKDYLNARVKHRESFRPFAPTVLEEYASEWFEIDGRESYMLRVFPVRKEKRDRIPAVVHVDGTARVQTLAEKENPEYWRIIEAFRCNTGVPLLLNTSFNVAGAPIVETPQDAVKCFLLTDIDVLVMGPFVLSKRPLSQYIESER